MLKVDRLSDHSSVATSCVRNMPVVLGFARSGIHHRQEYRKQDCWILWGGKLGDGVEWRLILQVYLCSL